MIEVVDASGASGWGECYGPTEVTQSAISSFYAPLLMGWDPLCNEAAWQRCWQASLDFARKGVMMGAIYENVWAETTLLDAGGETIVGAIGYDWFPNYELSKRHYYGPGDTWWGADVAMVSLGKGRCIVSQLRLVENLGKDPVADLLMFNMINWITR